MAVPHETNGGSKSSGAPKPELDVTKLHALPSEQQDLYLLTFTSDLARHISSLDSDGASAQQMYIKKELFQIVNLSKPAPTRAIRRNIGSSFAGIFGKGDRKLLFESVNELVAILGASKADKDIKAKHAAVHCLGALFDAAGDSAVSLSSLACTSAMKTAKLAQNHAGFRASIFQTVGSIVKAVGGSLDDGVARELWKQCRSIATSDKSLLVQIKACWALRQLAQHTPYFDNSSDFDKLQSSISKVIDSSSPRVRHAAASTLAAVLVKSYTENAPSKIAAPRVKKSKKSKKPKDAEDDDEIERPESPGVTRTVTRLSLSLEDILKHLGLAYIRPSTSAKARAGFAYCYIKVVRGLQEGSIQTNYDTIAQHLLNDVLSSTNISNNRYRLLTTRKYVRIILEDVIGREILGEDGQISAARYLINEIIKNYPQSLKERPEPSKQALTAALNALTSLMRSVGSAITVEAAGCREGLLQVLQHPNYTVQIHASACLREFVLACPQQLLPTITVCLNTVNRELGQLNGPQRSARRCIGFANALSAVLSTSTLQPLYGSLDVNSRVLSRATTLLKSSSSSDLRVSSVQIQVAWILIGGLMSLGPNFTKIHLTQLLLLWKNALPKPLNKENMGQRNLLELSFLAHVRECALGSILAFLDSNSRLLTLDVTKRLAGMLQNTAMFLSSLPYKQTTEDVAQRLSPSLQLQDFEIMVRRRVLQCYTGLINAAPTGSTEALLQTNLLPLAVSSFADPEEYAPSSLSVAIASSAGSFESVWDVNDNCGFGVSGLIKGYDVTPLAGEHNPASQRHWVSRRGPENEVDKILLSPVCSSREHDPIQLYLVGSRTSDRCPNSTSTQVVDAAIQLFATFLPLQTPKIQESMLEQISSYMSSPSLQRDPLRQAAMNVNIAIALLSALKVTGKETSSSPGDLRSPAVEKTIQDMLRLFLVDPDVYLRNLAAEAMGRLCSTSGNTMTTTQVKWLVDQIVSNREPSARAGCAVALGCIHSQLGGMAAGYHLKNILAILMSLANDPHPGVHFWALDSLSRVADSAGLTFSTYVSSTLGMLSQLLVGDNHNEEGGPFALSNLEVDMHTTAVIARNVDSVINVLGPDLQDMSKARDLILALVYQFRSEEADLVRVESIRCLDHLSLYDPSHADFEDYVRHLQDSLDSSSVQIRDIALDGLYNAMRRDSEEVLLVARPGFAEKLWLVLNARPDHEVAQNILLNWLRQTGLSLTAQWIHRCHSILTMTIQKSAQVQGKEEPKKPSGPDLRDEEVAGFAASSDDQKDSSAAGNVASQELLKWQVRTFAMDRLSDVIAMVTKDAASKEESTAVQALQSKVADVVRSSFTASTAGVVELRVRGLRILDQILKLFGKTPDPDFAEASLLEQYQAQIGSALTPAFAAESSPELAAQAVNVCATFIATGIVTDIERMGRILRLLVSALEKFSKDSDAAAIGDLQGLSSNAQVMVKMAVFSAWAELQIASSEQAYLVEVLRPHLALLTPLWLSSLREFARLRFEPDISTTAGSASLSGSLDTTYAALNRETLLKFYQESWLRLVDAIASLIEEDSALVFDALDGKVSTPNTPSGEIAKPQDINYRDEPVAFFFVLFGLAFEALVGRPGDSQNSQEHTLEILQALKKILRPSISGLAIYREIVFSETMDLLDRLTLTEGLNVQSVIVEIARNLCVSHPSARKESGSVVAEEKLSEDIDQLFELTRIIVLVIAGLVPNLTENKTRSHHSLTEEGVALISLSLSSLASAADVFPSIIKTDLHACILHIFTTILGTGTCQAQVVPQALPIFKRFLASLAENPQSDTKSQIRGTFTRALTILKTAQRRENEHALVCEKNCIMACTILLSSTSAVIEPADPLLEQFVVLLADCLGNRMTAKVAASCSRSLMLLPQRHPSESAITALLLPRLLSFLVLPSEVEGLGEGRTIVSASLVGLVTTSFKQQPECATTAMALVLPALVAGASNEGKAAHHDTARRLLELAAQNPMAFKSAVSGLTPEQKGFMEGLLKEAGVGRGRHAEHVKRDGGDEPTIALRMDFG